MLKLLLNCGFLALITAISFSAKAEDAGAIDGAVECATPCAGPCVACNGADLGWPGAVNGICAMAPVGYAAPSCSPVVCNGRASSCDPLCATDGDCIPGYYCNGSRSCVPKKSVGAACSADCAAGACHVCSTGQCVEGVCCDSSCEGTCVACTHASKGSGDDGVCGPVAQGTNGSTLCPRDAVGSCAHNGVCDGAGNCALYALSTECSPPVCTGSVPNATAWTYICDGKGACTHNPVNCPAGCNIDESVCAAETPPVVTPPVGTCHEDDCGGYVCAGASCRTTCRTIDDCTEPNVCHSDGKCGPFVPGPVTSCSFSGQVPPRGVAAGGMLAAFTALGCMLRPRRRLRRTLRR